MQLIVFTIRLLGFAAPAAFRYDSLTGAPVPVSPTGTHFGRSTG